MKTALSSVAPFERLTMIPSDLKVNWLHGLILLKVFSLLHAFGINNHNKGPASDSFSTLGP